MIDYNPKAWFTFIFRLHKSDTFRTLLPTMIGIAAFTLALAYIENIFLKIPPDHRITKLITVHTLLSFVISMLLVFRTNTAYERWWEGRKEWGALVNCSRNLSVKIKAMLHEPSDWYFFSQHIIFFPYILMYHLRGAIEKPSDALNAFYGQHSGLSHYPLFLSQLMYQKMQLLLAEKKITNEQYLSLDNELKQWMEICGKCERIKNTPIPFSYNVFIKKFIFFYVMLLPVAVVPVMGFYAIPIVVFIFYVLASLELLAEEIENPFGTEANDLPLLSISKNIEKSVHQVFSDLQKK